MLSLTDVQQQDEKENPDVVTLEEMQGGDQKEPEPSESPADELPEKYRGKSLVDVVRMHQEAEQHIGRQGQELGQARKDREYYQVMLDQAIANQTVKTDEAAPVEDIDFFADPEKAVQASIQKALASNPDIADAKALKEQVTKQATLSQLNTRHPDWKNISQAPEFAEWVKASPFRIKLAQQADGFDYGAADELFSLYKERSEYRETARQTEEQRRKQDVNTANTGSTQASGESRGKRTYRQSDIIELMKSDPARYRSMDKEFQAAFREGRVIMDRS